MSSASFGEMFGRLIRAEGQARSAKTVEIFGWLILVQGTLFLFAPQLVASLLQLPPLGQQASNYLRLVGLLVGGIGMLYVASGRLNSEGFVFASMLDRPLVPGIMIVLWYLNVLPGTLALAFSVQDFGSFLWTLSAWRAEAHPVRPALN